MNNPFATGENRLVEPLTALIIFGASGSNHRKLIPAIKAIYIWMDIYLLDFIVESFQIQAFR
ncbi:MAG: hypothetical protein R3A13_03810 [Bdellovibrionota bacterium]